MLCGRGRRSHQDRVGRYRHDQEPGCSGESVLRLSKNWQRGRYACCRLCLGRTRGIAAVLLGLFSLYLLTERLRAEIPLLHEALSHLEEHWGNWRPDGFSRPDAQFFQPPEKVVSSSLLKKRDAASVRLRTFIFL